MPRLAHETFVEAQAVSGRGVNPKPLRMQDDSDPTRKVTSAEIRAAMPLCTAFGDWVREDFKSIAYIKASENGFSVEWGSKLQNGKEAEGC